MPFRGVVDGYTAGEAQQLDVNIDEALHTHASSGALCHTGCGQRQGKGNWRTTGRGPPHFRFSGETSKGERPPPQGCQSKIAGCEKNKRRNLQKRLASQA